MNKKELIVAAAAASGLSQKDVEKALKAFTEAVVEEVAQKGKVQLIGFGTFEARERAARTGKNPQTGAAIKIAADRQKKLKKLKNKFCFPNGLSVIQADRFYVTYCIANECIVDRCIDRDF